MIVELNQENFDENIKSGLKLVEFFAPWCGHCQRQAPILEELDKVWIGKVDSDLFPNLLKKHNVQSFPTFILFNDGKELIRFSGFHTKFEIMDIISRYIK